MRRRRLSDLYVRGKELSITDGDGEPVKVWLQKLNEVDRDNVFRRANAARAQFMIESDNEDSDLFRSMYATVRTFEPRETLLSVVIAEDVAKARQRVEAQLTHDEDSWAKDGYLQGLLDAWQGDDDHPGLSATQLEDPDDPEAARVWAELQRFETEVIDLVRHEADALRADWAAKPDDALWREAARHMLKRAADDTFSRNFDRQQLFYCARDPDDHAKRYFEKVVEIDDLDDELRKHLIDQCNALTVDIVEGKDSRVRLASSSSPEPPSPTPEPSGLEVVSA